MTERMINSIDRIYLCIGGGNKLNKNLAIANRSRISCAHDVEGTHRPKYYTVTLKSRLRSLKITGITGQIIHDLIYY